MNVLNYLDESERKHPEKIAISDETEQISFRELRRRAESIGTALIRHNSSMKNRPVAVLIDRNAASICVFVGIVESGNFYVPIDTSLPKERIETIITSIEPDIIVSIHGNVPKLNLSKGYVFEEYDEMVNEEADLELLKQIRSEAIDTDPLYAICTSGSTGIPKAVLIAQRSVLDFIPVFTKTFNLSENDVFGNQAPFDFDVSVKDIYSSLYLGATLHIIPKVCFVMPKKLVEFLDEYKITTIIWAVSAMCILSGVNAFKYICPKYLNKIMFSGEVMPIKMLNIWRTYFPNALFVNLYGPTEITCNCMYYIVDREFEVTETLPLGKAFENERIYVLKEDNTPAQAGEEGEICVVGTCLALGYYNDLEKTRKAFVQNPINHVYEERMYKTGDLARIAEDGSMYYTARKDFQIKHMGHRIELEEIQLHMNAVEGVNRCCCFLDEKANKIVAVYQGEIEKKILIDALKDKVPKYMIPNIMIKVTEMPLNKNGKIDRNHIINIYAEGLISGNTSKL